jgi:hypothetical protein
MSEEELQVETIEEDSSDFELEIEDDTPEEDRGRPRRPDGTEPDIGSEEELEDYSGKVQSRIKKLRFEYHEERRQKEEAQRLRDEAIAFAEKKFSEAENYRKRLTEGENVLVGEAKGRLAAEIEKAKNAYKQAYEIGDSDALTEAQMKMSELTTKKSRYDSYRPKEYQPAQNPFQQAQQKAEQQPLRADPQAEEWARNNSWFGQNKRMTAYAMGVHDELVSNGVNPTSQEYYNEIDKAIGEAFSSDTGGSVRQESGSVVAPATRSSKSPRKIRLTTTQVALAKRLGLSPEQYAAQLMKEKQ